MKKWLKNFVTDVVLIPVLLLVMVCVYVIATLALIAHAVKENNSFTDFCIQLLMKLESLVLECI